VFRGEEGGPRKGSNGKLMVLEEGLKGRKVIGLRGPTTGVEGPFFRPSNFGSGHLVERNVFTEREGIGRKPRIDRDRVWGKLAQSFRGSLVGLSRPGWAGESG